jgi:glycine cleavage system H lipoate-binding protein
MRMVESLFANPFGTKGVEYAFVIGFLLLLIWFWRVLNRPARKVSAAAGPAKSQGWFRLPADLFYHPGHTWVTPREGGVYRVGLDDFAQKLLGRPSTLTLPAPGERVQQGDRGWMVQVDSKTIEVLSPMDGEVVGRNEAAVEDPDRINSDPYGEGWLIEVKASRPEANLKSLLHGAMARAWMEISENTLRQRISGRLGLVMQDGGDPVSGLARAISPDQWEEVARDFLLSR